MKNIFGYLLLEQNPNYVGELEEKYNIQLPPIFKAFVQTFEFGKLETEPKHSLKHPNEELGFGGLETHLENKFIAYSEIGDYYQTDMMLPIIPSGIYAGGICLGLKDENADGIFLYTEDWDEKFELISENILKFVSELRQVHWNEV